MRISWKLEVLFLTTAIQKTQSHTMFGFDTNSKMLTNNPEGKYTRNDKCQHFQFRGPSFQRFPISLEEDVWTFLLCNDASPFLYWMDSRPKEFYTKIKKSAIDTRRRSTSVYNSCHGSCITNAITPGTAKTFWQSDLFTCFLPERRMSWLRPIYTNVPLHPTHQKISVFPSSSLLL